MNPAKSTERGSIPVTRITLGGAPVDVLRLDLAHPVMPGNKYYKLKYNLEEARKQGFDTLLSFGGAFSNHIHALAAAGREEGFHTIGVIRGEAHTENPTLTFARSCGMHLLHISREKYAQKHKAEFLADLEKQFGRFYLIPEGGSNALAIKGCSEILFGIGNNYDSIFCPVGTGSTLAGLVATPGLCAKIFGIAVLQDMEIPDRIAALLQEFPAAHRCNYEVSFDYVFGGFARKHPVPAACARKLLADHDLRSDPVYSAKMFAGAEDMLRCGKANRHGRSLAIHTGGLQGIAGWELRYGKWL